MPQQRPVDKLIEWSIGKSWGFDLEEIFREIVEPVCEDYEIAADELPEILGPALFDTLFGAAVECFLTDYDDDGENVIDVYLKKRGWKENSKTREYLAALRDSSPSLYEVSDIVRGEGFAVRDQVRGGEPVHIKEHLGSLEIKPWSRIYARIVTVRGATMMTGAILVFTPELAEEVLEYFAQATESAPELMKALKAVAGVPDEELSGDADDDAEVLASALVVEVVQMWLDATLFAILEMPLPELRNTDGDPLEFQTIYYRLRETARPGEIRAALGRVPDVVSDGDDAWTWASAVEDGEVADQATILGNLELEERTLTLVVNSEKRAKRARELFDPALAGLVGKPLIEHQSTEQMLAKARETRRGRAPVREPLPPPEEEKQIISSFLDQHYRKLLDEPIPALDGLTPRDAVKTKTGCDKTVNWLKQAESASAALGSPGLMIDHDLTWMWKELGILARRK